MTPYHKLIIAYILFINCFAYVLMCYDKWQAKKKVQRIPESTFMSVAFLLGALGVYLGTKGPLYHKAAKPKFKIGIPFMLLLNSIVFYFIYRWK